MEFFSGVKAVRLRSHLDKYLIADDDRETVRQSRNAASRRAVWEVELVPGNRRAIRLRSCHGGYLTASDTPFLLGATGKRVVTHGKTAAGSASKNYRVDSARVEWVPERDGFQVKLRTGGNDYKYLRANGGTPPWRNSVTHDSPHTSATANWVLWDVEAVEVPGGKDASSAAVDFFCSWSSNSSSFSSIASDDGFVSVLPSPPRKVPPKTSNQAGMEMFRSAKAVRLRSHHDKYLLADDDEESVSMDRDGASQSARWTVEFPGGGGGSELIVRLKSRYGKYLTASNQPFLLGMTGCKVLQTLPPRLDSSVEWIPVRDGALVKFRTRYGNFLRANAGLPPWRNSVTHDIPHRTVTQDWILWEVQIVEIDPSHHYPPRSSPDPTHLPTRVDSHESDSYSYPSTAATRQESMDSLRGSPPKVEGRTIYYRVADDGGAVEEDGGEGYCLTFKGNGVDELTKVLEEELGYGDIMVCSRSTLNGKLYPLRLQLPPNNATMHVVVLHSSSQVARDLARSP